MKYNRGSVQDSLRAAQKMATKHAVTYYAFATAGGMFIGLKPPPFGQQHYIVTAQGMEYVTSK